MALPVLVFVIQADQEINRTNIVAVFILDHFFIKAHQHIRKLIVVIFPFLRR